MLGEFDAYLLPVSITTAFPHSAPRSPILVDGEPVDSRLVDHYLYPFNLTGHPAVCVPCGFIKGLPQAIMFTGELYDEGAPLRVALAYERVTKWHTMLPKMDWV